MDEKRRSPWITCGCMFLVFFFLFAQCFTCATINYVVNHMH